MSDNGDQVDPGDPNDTQVFLVHISFLVFSSSSEKYHSFYFSRTALSDVKFAFFKQIAPLKNHVKINPAQQDALNLISYRIASDFPQNRQSFKLQSPIGFVFQKLKYVCYLW